jgi:hypothetical protein
VQGDKAVAVGCAGDVGSGAAARATGRRSGRIPVTSAGGMQ